MYSPQRRYQLMCGQRRVLGAWLLLELRSLALLTNELMRRAIRATVDHQMPDRKGTLSYSGAGKAISPQNVHDMHAWFSATAIASWQSPAAWSRSELEGSGRNSSAHNGIQGARHHALGAVL